MSTFWDSGEALGVATVGVVDIIGVDSQVVYFFALLASRELHQDQEHFHSYFWCFLVSLAHDEIPSLVESFSWSSASLGYHSVVMVDDRFSVLLARCTDQVY